MCLRRLHFLLLPEAALCQTSDLLTMKVSFVRINKTPVSVGEAKIEEEMKNQDQLKLKDNERKASQELKQKILVVFS